MGVISAEMYEALLLADVPEDKAKAAAAEVAKTQDFASKSDVRELGAQLQAEIGKRFAEVEKSLVVLKFAVFSGDRSCSPFCSSLYSFRRPPFLVRHAAPRWQTGSGDRRVSHALLAAPFLASQATGTCS